MKHFVRWFYPKKVDMRKKPYSKRNSSLKKKNPKVKTTESTVPGSKLGTQRKKVKKIQKTKYENKI